MDKFNISTSCSVMVLAAGLGKRMRSPLPKVLHEISGKPLIFHVLERVRECAPNADVSIVVGYGREQVESFIRNEPRFQNMKISMITQAEQKGTGHAARCAMDSVWGNEQIKNNIPVLVLPGDLPLIPKELVTEMLAPLKKTDVIRLLTCELVNPKGYGRIVRKAKKGSVLKIVEEKDASLQQKKIKEVGASIYLFQSRFLKEALKKISNQNAQGEYYLTDVISQAIQTKKGVNVLKWESEEDLRGVNDLWELSQAAQILNRRAIQTWASHGVRFLSPAHTWLDAEVQLSEGVIIGQGSILSGRTHVGKNSVIGPYTTLKNVEVGEGVHIKTGTVAEDSQIGSYSQIGPYAHLRPQSKVGINGKIGNFVELKKTEVGESTSIAHLSYLGDAIVGKNVNIGCGFVTCNFDGRVIQGEKKHRTIIEDDVFLGSDCQTIAPVKIGKGAYIASGSTITKDVEPEALAIARSRQVNKAGYARRLRPAKEKG